MEGGDPGLVGKVSLFCVPQSVKTKETNPIRPGSPTPCKQALSELPYYRKLTLYEINTNIFALIYLNVNFRAVK